MNLRLFVSKLKQAQFYNPVVMSSVVNQLQAPSFITRSINLALWGLFHIVRIYRTPISLRSLIKNQVNQNHSIESANNDNPWKTALSATSQTTLGNRVLIIAELSLVQCKKYRVTQKTELFSLLGYETTVLPWNDYLACRNALQTHGMVIFYRTPATPDVKRLVAETRSIGLVSFFDLDDLIFDLEEYSRHANVQRLSKHEFTVLMDGASMYREMLQLTDHAIASTAVIAEKMQSLCRGSVFTLENCLDSHLLSLSTLNYPPPGKDIIIGYGSGTRTHDADFMVAAPALLRILDNYPNVRLAIYGHLELTEDFLPYATRIVRVPFLDPDDYYLSLARFSINLAPLEKSIFNDSKSNIKYLEASLFGVPSVCSPADAFKGIIRHGENGFLAESTDEWFTSLSRLVEDSDLRLRIGTTAKQNVLAHYSPAAIAQQQLNPILSCGLPLPQKKKLRIMMVNLLFAPLSFGGATIVAEQLAAELAAMEDTEVCVFTGCWHADLPTYDLARYEWKNIPIFAVGLPSGLERSKDYDNPTMAARFDEVLNAVQPDIVHFHSIQILSATLADTCHRLAIPYVITLHDAWWLCERQFMVRSDGTYCNQQGVNLVDCNGCTPDSAFTHHRFHRLWKVMQNAALLLAPSEFQRNLYIQTGIPEEHIRVNKNGILPSLGKRAPKHNHHITFAFLGGRAIHKGYFFLQDVFSSISENNYTLYLVDIESKMGNSQMYQDTWQISGKMEIVPPYEQHEMDRFFDKIDVLLFPSQCKESFGLTVREAMARNIWIIATDCGGPIEDLVDGKNGNITAMHDKEAFRNAIVALLHNPEHLKNYQNPYREHLRYFSQQAAELNAILSEVVLRKKTTTVH